jgi:hypothetical protein
MEKTKLDNINDRILVKIINNILEELSGIDAEWDEAFDRSEYYDVYESNIRTLGVRPETIDVDYIFSIIRLNIKNEFKLPLSRPNLGLYEVNIEISERVLQKQTYEHRVYSYDDGIATKKFSFEEDLGMVSIYDGEITDTEVFDAESYDWSYLDPIKIKEF